MAITLSGDRARDEKLIADEMAKLSYQEFPDFAEVALGYLNDRTSGTFYDVTDNAEVQCPQCGRTITVRIPEAPEPQTKVQK